MTQPQANQNPARVPTIPVDENSELAPTEVPSLSPVDEMMRVQRGQRHRLVMRQHNNGQPIRNRPKPDPEKVKLLRKLVKRIRRGVPVRLADLAVLGI